MQRKILFVDHTGVMGGAELSLLDLATAHRETSKVLLFQDGPFYDRLTDAGVKARIARAESEVLELKASAGLDALKSIPGIWNLAGAIAEEAKGYDLVVANSQKAFIAAAVARLRNSPPLVWHLRDILTARHFSPINRKVAVLLANSFAHRVIVNSEATGKAFVAAGGKPKLVKVVYNGFESAKFDGVTESETTRIRADLGVGDNPLVGLFSRLSYWKGQHVLLEAIAKVPQAHAVFVGDALFGEQEYVARLQELVRTLKIEDRVHWLGFRQDIPQLMKACDIIAHTSTEPEPFGRVIVEGQLAQKPVIASGAGGALELIEPGVTGYLFPLEEAEVLSDRISSLLKEPELAMKIALQGYHHAKNNFALETIVESFDEAIADI